MACSALKILTDPPAECAAGARRAAGVELLGVTGVPGVTIVRPCACAEAGAEERGALLVYSAACDHQHIRLTAGPSPRSNAE